MQQMWNQLAMMGMLTLCSAQDMRKKQIQLNLVLAFGILGILFHMLWRTQSIGSLLSGMAVGLVLLILALLSDGRIGEGDGVLLIVTGIYLGLEGNLELLFSGLLLCGLWALALLVFRKKKRQDTIPFVPFLLAAYVGMLVCGV
jgi:leader peptidase (prepilin peptidase)/N-methyltransferase